MFQIDCTGYTPRQKEFVDAKCLALQAFIAEQQKKGEGITSAFLSGLATRAYTIGEAVGFIKGCQFAVDELKAEAAKLAKEREEKS